MFRIFKFKICYFKRLSESWIQIINNTLSLHDFSVLFCIIFCLASQIVLPSSKLLILHCICLLVFFILLFLVLPYILPTHLALGFPLIPNHVFLSLLLFRLPPFFPVFCSLCRLITFVLSFAFNLALPFCVNFSFFSYLASFSLYILVVTLIFVLPSFLPFVL